VLIKSLSILFVTGSGNVQQMCVLLAQWHGFVDLIFSFTNIRGVLYFIDPHKIV